MKKAEISRKRAYTTAAALVAAALFALFPIRSFAEDNKISEGIYIGEVYVGGQTPEEAGKTIESYVKGLLGRNITLYTVSDETITVTPGEIGFAWSNPEVVEEAYNIGRTGNVVSRYKEKKDLERSNRVLDLQYTVDDELVKKILNEKCSVYDVAAVEGKIERVDGSFVITGGVAGETLDIEASAGQLEHYLCSEWAGDDTSYHLVVVTKNPEGSEADLALVKDELGTFSTSFKSSNESRSTNIRNGASLINGNIIYPGEEYSFYEHVAPITYDNGYLVGQAYYSGRVVDSVGGGICQVSTTLYNAVLYSELQITERHNHGMTVSYVDPGRDATIAESSGKDFKFVNTTDAPIYIDAYTTSDKQIVVTLYGHETRPASREVVLESEVLSKSVPEEVVFVEDPAQPVGYVSIQGAHTGYKAKLWKTVTENGVSEKTEVNTSTYAASPRYVTVGVATTDPNVQAVMAAAMASGDEATVKSTASTCKTLIDNPGALVPLPEIPAPAAEVPVQEAPPSDVPVPEDMIAE